MPLLEVNDLMVYFPVRSGFFKSPTEWVKAVNNVSLTIEPGETLGLVGESGCGKTTLGRAIMQLTPATEGSIQFDGQELSALRESELRSVRRGFQMVFQDPFSSLNPQMRISEIIAEPLQIHGLYKGPEKRRKRVLELLDWVGLSAQHADRFPHEFSGGQRQRIGIARSLAAEPKLIVCDEPVSALDVSVQAQIINLLCDLRDQHQLAYLFIAHDLAVVEHISHRIAVMYLGQIVELAPASSLATQALHPYTKALISAVPQVDPESKTNRIKLPGEVPSPINPPAGCPFHPRCPVAEDRCRTTPPTLKPSTEDHSVACHLAD